MRFSRRGGCPTRGNCQSSRGPDALVLGDRYGVKEGLHRGFPIAPAALMGSCLVVLCHPSVEIGLQLIDRHIDPLAEGNAIELIEHCFVEALANAVGLRAPRFGPGMVDILDRQVQLVLVVLGVATIFGAAIGQHPAERDLVLVEERDNPVV